MRINIPELVHFVTSITRAIWNQRWRAALTDQKIFIAMLLTIKFVVKNSAR